MTLATIRPAAVADLTQIAALSLEALPELVRINESPWEHRVGSGETWHSNLLIVGVDQCQRVLGVAWADAAIARDHGYLVPWWCLNVLAVSPGSRRLGLGTRLLEDVYERAVAAGVSSLYGLCDPQLAAWYARQGFSVTEPGSTLQSDAVPAGGAAGTLELTGPDDQCWFLTDVCSGPLPRLYLPLMQHPARLLTNAPAYRPADGTD